MYFLLASLIFLILFCPVHKPPPRAPPPTSASSKMILSFSKTYNFRWTWEVRRFASAVSTMLHLFSTQQVKSTFHIHISLTFFPILINNLSFAHKYSFLSTSIFLIISLFLFNFCPVFYYPFPPQPLLPHFWFLKNNSIVFVFLKLIISGEPEKKLWMLT